MRLTDLKLRAIILLAVSLAALSASAATYNIYRWSQAGGGAWSTAGAWTLNDASTEQYPGDTSRAGSSQDHIGRPATALPFTITLDSDMTVYGNLTQDDIAMEYAGTGLWTFDLGGHKLDLTYLCYHGCGAPSGFNVLPARGIEFRNGVVTFTENLGFRFTGYSSQNPSCIVFSDCIVTSRCELAGYSSSIIVREGAKWVMPTGRHLVLPYENGTSGASWYYTYLCVTGAESSVEAPGSNLTLQRAKAGCFLFEGTSASFANVYVGPSALSSDSTLDVRGATLTVGSTLQLGSDKETGSRSDLTVRGGAAKVTAPLLSVYEGKAATVALEIPEGGFDLEAGEAVAPLRFGAIAFTPRAAGYADLGAFAFKVSCYDWMRAHPEETIPLVTLDTADEEALAAFADAVVWADVPSVLVESGKGPTLSISADKTTLSITSPKINYKPAFSFSTRAGDAVGEKTFVINLSDYGADASSITSISLEFADNPDFTGKTVRELLDEPVTADLPLELAYSVDGGFVEWRRYYARVTLTNGGAYTESAETAFYGDAIAQTLSWKGSCLDGIWQDENNWKTNGVYLGQYPHAEDTVHLGWGSFDTVTTLTLTDDVSIVQFDGSTAYPGISYGRWAVDLNGHTLDINNRNGFMLTVGCSTSSAAKMDLATAGPVIEFRNGTILTVTNRWNYNTGLALGCVGKNESGTIVFDNVTASAYIPYYNNSSRVFVRNGSRLCIPVNCSMQNHTGIGAYPALCVTGANSRVELPADQRFAVRGNGAACYVLDGAAFTCGTFCIGWRSYTESGDLSSDLTLAKLDNGTLTTVSDLTIGWSGTTEATKDIKLSAKLSIGGESGCATVGGALTIYENLGTVLEFALPAAGYRATPLTAGSLAFVARASGLTDYGATKVNLTGVKAWAKRHPNEMVELIRLTAANAAGLEALKANATLDWTKLDASALAVTADGTALTLTAPSKPGVALIVR